MTDLINSPGRLALLFLIVLFSLPGTPSIASATGVYEQSVTRSEWPEFANGANLAALPPLRQVLGRFDEQAGTRIEIRYPGGDGGEAWAREIRQWFIAYGVPSGFLDLAPGSGAGDRLLIILIQR